MARIIFVVISMILEISAILSVFIHAGYFFSIAVFMILHAASACFLSFALYMAMPERYKKNYAVLILFYLLFFFALSAEFLAFLSLDFLYGRSTAEREEALHINPGHEIGYKTIPLAGRQYGEGSVLSRLSTPGVSVPLKQTSLLYLIDKTPALSYKLVKESVYDPSDEIRLLAFSLLSKTENDINKKISALKKYLSYAKKGNEGEIRFDLAGLHWTLVYMNITDKEFESYNLDQAKDNILKAIKQKYKYFDALLLLGRIYLKLGDREQAEGCLNKSLSREFLKNRAIPYLAEIYYLKGDFWAAKRLFMEMESRPLNNRLNNILELWTS